jgi:hypothetical protein
MTDERKVQLGVEVDSTGARKGFEDVTRSAKSMADKVAASVKPASTAVDKIGAGGDAAAQKLDRSTQNMIASIQRTTAAMEAGDKSTSKYFETLAKQRGISSEALRPYLTQLDAAKAKQDAATTSLDKMGVSANFLRSMLLQLGGVLSVTAIVQWATGVASAASALDDLAEATGSSVESLSQLANIAQVSGVSFDTIDTAIKKLAVGLAGTDEESTKAGKALALMGIQARDPAEALKEVALKFQTYADGANKAALANAIWKGSGASMISVLKDIAENQGIASTVTTQQAKAAEDLEKSWRRLGVESVTLKNALLDNIVPALTTTITSFNLARAAGMGFFDALKNAGNYDLVGTQKRILEIESEIRKNEKAVQDYAARGMKAPQDTIQKKVDELKKESAFLQSVLNTLVDKMPDRMPQDARPDAPIVPGGSQTKQQIADYRDEILKLNDEMLKLSSPAGGYSHLIAANEKYQADLLAGKVIKTEEVQRMMRTAVALDELVISTKKWADAEKEAGDYAKQVAKERADYEKSVLDSQDAVRLLVGNLEQEVATLGLSNAQRELSINLLKLENSGLDKNSQEYADLEQRIRAAADAKEVFAAQKTLADDFKKTADSIADSLTDALLRGFEDGKSFGKNFVDTLYNLFRTLVLKPVISAIVAPISTGVASMFGGTAAASAGGSAGGRFLGSAAGSMFGSFGSGASMSISNMGSMGLFAGTAQNFSNIGALASGGDVLGALGMAAPYIAGAVAIGMLVKSFLDSKKGGPKSGGYGFAGDITSVNRNDLFTPSNSDSTATAIAQASSKAFNETIKALGGSGAAGFDLGFNSDPQGSANNQLGVRAFVNGQQVYGYSAGESLGRDDAALEAAINTESKRALLAALQASDLPDQIAAVFDAVQASSASADMIDKLLSFGSAMKVVVDAIGGDVTVDAQAAWEKSQRTAVEVLSDMGAEVMRLAGNVDGSVESMQALATATTDYRSAVVQTLVAIKQISSQVDDMFAATRDSLTSFGLTPEQMFKRYMDDADAATALLATAKDPTTIANLAARINADINNAFGALGDDAKGSNQSGLLAYLDQVSALAQSRLTAAWDAVGAGTKDPFAAANKALDDAAGKFATAVGVQATAADTMLLAANTILRASQTPLTVQMATAEVG